MHCTRTSTHVLVVQYIWSKLCSTVCCAHASLVRSTALLSADSILQAGQLLEQLTAQAQADMEAHLQEEAQQLVARLDLSKALDPDVDPGEAAATIASALQSTACAAHDRGVDSNSGNASTAGGPASSDMFAAHKQSIHNVAQGHLDASIGDAQNASTLGPKAGSNVVDELHEHNSRSKTEVVPSRHE